MSFDQVKEFNDTFGVVTRSEGNVRVPEAQLRFELIREEFEELSTAYKNVDVVEVADALGDIRYVAIGAAQVFGVSLFVELRYWDYTEEYTGEILLEEIQEKVLLVLRNSILKNNTSEVVDILALILKMVDDAAKFLSIDLDRVVSVIHKSNMSKLGENGEVIRRVEDNKVLKGPNYAPPTEDIKKILFG